MQILFLVSKKFDLILEAIWPNFAKNLVSVRKSSSNRRVYFGIIVNDYIMYINVFNGNVMT